MRNGFDRDFLDHLSKRSYVPTSEMITTDLLGTGKFNVVLCGYTESLLKSLKSTLSEPRLRVPSCDDDAGGESDGLTAAAAAAVSPSSTGNSTSKRFAVKRLKAETLAKPDLAEHASRDLAFEALCLLKLPPHEHIVNLHGLSNDFWHDTPITTGFLILDLLADETLDLRINRLKRDKSAVVAMAPWTSSFRKKLHDKQRIQQEERIERIGLPIACAMSFLHSHHIVHRDLKPSNIGFEEGTDNVRLFDFGLAREHHGEDDDVLLTGVSGSLRYMAPEGKMGTGLDWTCLSFFGGKGAIQFPFLSLTATHLFSLPCDLFFQSHFCQS